MNKERLEQIKENVYTRCSIATQTGIGLTTPDKEELELIDEIDRLNNIINELEKFLNEKWDKPLANIYVADVVKKISELKESSYE